MKAVITGDWHIGKNPSGRVNLGNEFMKSFDWMIDYMIKNEIENIIHCGDLWDTKRFVNFEMHRIWRHVLNVLERHNIRLFVAHGNHDVPSVKDMGTSLFDLVQHSNNVMNFGDVTEWDIEDETVLFVPYGLKSKIEGAADDVDILICHEDIPPVYEGVHTFSGHIHQRSDVFVGTLAQLDWGQVGDEVGFIHYDAKSWKWVNNPKKTFQRVELIEGKIDGLNPVKWVMNNRSNLAGANLEVKVDELTDKTLYQKLVAVLETVSLNDLQLTEVIEFSQEPLKNSSHDVLTLISNELTRAGAKERLAKIVGKIL